MPLAADQIDATQATAAAAGAVASALANRAPDSKARKICEALAGAAVGIYCGPAAAEQAHIATPHAAVAVSFLVGASGMLMLTLFLDVMKTGSLRTWLERFLVGPTK